MNLSYSLELKHFSPFHKNHKNKFRVNFFFHAIAINAYFVFKATPRVFLTLWRSSNMYFLVFISYIYGWINNWATDPVLWNSSVLLGVLFWFFSPKLFHWKTVHLSPEFLRQGLGVWQVYKEIFCGCWHDSVTTVFFLKPHWSYQHCLLFKADRSNTWTYSIAENYCLTLEPGFPWLKLSFIKFLSS